MNYLEIPAGTYSAKAVSMTGGKSKNGNPFIKIEFNIPDVDANLRKDFYLTPAAKPYSIETLMTLEFTGDKSFRPGSFNAQKEVQLVVERKVGQDGVERPEIRYVNDPSKPRASAFDNDESALDGFNFKAEMAAVKSQTKTPSANFGISTEEEFGF